LAVYPFFPFGFGFALFAASNAFKLWPKIERERAEKPLAKYL